MRCLVLFICLFILSALHAQVRDITPYLTADDAFFDLNGDSQGNLYIVKKKNYTGVAVLSWNSGWTEVIGYADKPVQVTSLDDQLYVITEVPMSSYHYKLQILSTDGWHDVSTTELNGSVTDIMLLPGKQIAVRGKFKFAGGEHRFARWNNGKWEPVPSPADKEIADMLVTGMAFSPQADEKGVLYFYTWKGGATPGNEVISWDGTNWKKYGLFGKYRVNDIAVAPNGNLYAGNSSPAGLLEWNGSTWNLITCNAKGYDGGAFKAAAVNESNEVYVAGEAKKKKDHVIYKYSRGEWQEFAKTPGEAISSLYYNNGNLYVKTEDYHLFQVGGAGKPNEKKEAPVVTAPNYNDRAKEMEKIYSDYVREVTSIWQPVADAVKFFNSSYEDNEKTESIARTGIESIKTLNAKLNEYKARIGRLDLGTNHQLSVTMTDYLNASLKHNNTWNTLFSCYVKDDDACVDATKNLLPAAIKDFKDKTHLLDKVATGYRN